MKCYYCGDKGELFWQSDFSYEDMCLDGEGIVTFLMCSNEECEATVQVYKDV